VFFVAAGAALAVAQSPDDGIVLEPHAHVAPVPRPKPVPTTLLVSCDLACIWTLDGKPQGRIDAASSSKAVVDPGQHLLLTCTEDGQDTSQQTIEAKAAAQTSVAFELGRIREARLQEEQARRDAAEHARQQEIERQKELARQEEMERQKEAERQQQIARQQDLHQEAGERLRQGTALYHEQRFAEARPLFAASCDGGNLQACNWLGFQYDHAQGVAQDEFQALNLYRTACAGGVIPACNNLGYLFEHGRGVPVDFERARGHYQHACQLGDPVGCLHLGNLFAQGHGVPQDVPRARALYLRACAGGEQSGCQAARLVP
jgi:TPR repeat protein